MFPGIEESRRALRGAWQLFLSRPQGMAEFDLGVEGFWRSFRAIWLTLPAYVLASILEFQRLSAPPAGTSATLADPPEGFAFIAEKTLALGLDWVALPIVLALIAPRIGVSRTYPAFIIVRNWAAVIAAVPFGLVAAARILGLLDDATTSFLLLASLALLLRYNFIVARAALEVGIGFAIAVVVGDFILSLLIATSMASLFGIAGLQ
jgi:hypothetical protein